MGMDFIDLRSDTFTKPTASMRAAMAEAEVGDDVYGEDPTVNRLEKIASEMLGTEDAIFASSGTQSNLLALLAHCDRGDEYIVGQTAHTYRYEGGGAAVLGSIQPQPLDLEPDGTVDLGRAEAVIKPRDFHFARTRLLCLENTQAGQALPVDYIPKARKFTHKHGLKLHLDGARIFNAAVKQKIPASEISRHFDSVSVCLSKGLGAPVGSVLCSTANVVNEARRWRKVLGGGMRQAGIIAAGGIFALENHIARLQEDHDKAERLAEGLAGIDELTVEYSHSQTNMVFIEVENVHSESLSKHMREKGILIPEGKRVRLVTHLDIIMEDIPRVIEAFKNYFRLAAE